MPTLARGEGGTTTHTLSAVMADEIAATRLVPLAGIVGIVGHWSQPVMQRQAARNERERKRVGRSARRVC